MHRAFAPVIIVSLLAPLALAVDSKSADNKSASKHPVVRTYEMRPLPEGQVNILACGDWGENTREQRQVGQTMSSYVTSRRVQFNGEVSVGDNVYVKLKGVDDPMWQALFEDMYDARTLNFPFYLTLGNHDYEQDKAKLEILYTQKNPDSRWKLPSRWYRVDLPEGKPLVTMLMLDSNKPHITRADWSAQIQWIEQQLKGPHAPWVIAVAHHPFFSNGSHGDIGVLQLEWGTLFRKYGLDFYIAGHDHDLQHIEVKGWPMSFMQVGGGARPPTQMRRDNRGPFSRQLRGFAHLQFFPDHCHVTYINGMTGDLVHEFDKTKSGEVTVLRTTGRDRRSTKPLQIIEGFDQKHPTPGSTADQ